MLGLTNYSSSSEDEDAPAPPSNAKLPGQRQTVRAIETAASPAPATLPSRPTDTPTKPTTPSAETVPAQGPTLGPSRPDDGPDAAEDGSQSGSQSPYTTNRTALRNLTLPPNPSFIIPDSPPGSPPPNSTAKFTKFLELKKKGTHFNERLATSAQLRNPALLDKLREFSGIDDEEQYASTLEGALGWPTRWPEEVYVERLAAAQQELAKARETERKGQRREFVPESSSGGGESSKRAR